jgi:hypothetical protein
MFDEIRPAVRIDCGKEADSELEHTTVSVNCKVRYMPVSTKLHAKYRKVQQKFMKYLYHNM